MTVSGYNINDGQDVLKSIYVKLGVEPSVQSPGAWAAIVGLINAVAGWMYLWTALRSLASVVVVLAAGVGFLVFLGNLINLESMMGEVSVSGFYTVGFGLLLACAVGLILIALGITAFVLERVSIAAPSPREMGERRTQGATRWSRLGRALE
ncbi:hypothetical protein MELE44368_01730 [Mycolicibacterium elephantis DSM 44368]|uniref:Uncharacterized protein n=1 Tax=Mycolicibacterium elephantis DSM 44368 TaxID=1335622 RepID=A0A439E0K3_9MYCO|nr:hypothetical protein MELE44368_01730 [Mycolicibacterium elephantis DSM 44368]